MQTILFTTDEEVLERIARNDPLYQEDVVESARAESATSRAFPALECLETVSAETGPGGGDGADEQSPLDRPHTRCSRVAANTRHSGTAAGRPPGPLSASAAASADQVFKSRSSPTSAADVSSNGEAFTFQSRIFLHKIAIKS